MASDIWPKYWVTWWNGYRAGKSGGSVPATSASPAPPPRRYDDAIGNLPVCKRDWAYLRPMARSVTGTPISGHAGTAGVTSMTVMDPAQD
jgi:hypothetical protein